MLSKKSATSALRVALIYVIFAACWILFSDMVVEFLVADRDLFAQIQTFKGLAFVVITALLLFVLMLKNNQAIELANDMDSLTGLHNINLFIRALDVRIKNLRPDESLTLANLDIDDFKTINESLGFERGDELLKELATQFAQRALPGSIVARVQADQFASFGTGNGNVDMGHYVRGFQAVFNQCCKNLGIDATSSMGVATYPVDGRNAKELMLAVTEALYMAKTKKNAIQYHDKALSEKALQRRQMVIDLQHAITNEHLTVVYQPKYSINDNLVSGVEVLVRWNHPEHGFIPPDQFIPLAEEHGLSNEISKLVIKQASREMQSSSLLGSQLQHVAVNVSATEFNNAAEMKQLTDFILTHSTFASYMRIEITETAMLNDMQKSLGIISKLQGSGISFSVDDFGTGYTSLTMLKDLTVDEIKIDRSFVAELEKDARSKTIIKAIIDMAKSFEINVVAEGVETIEQLTILQSLGCQEAQGYFLGRPMPMDRLITHLQG